MTGCLFPGAAVAHSLLSLKLEGSRAFAQLLVLPGGLASLACRRITAASASGVTWLLLWSVSVVSVSPPLRRTPATLDQGPPCPTVTPC